MNALSPRAAYALWAAAYEETAISHLENLLVAGLTPPLSGLRLLDAGCGTGRRLLEAGAARAVGVDLSPEMLAAGIGRLPSRADLSALVADIRALPLPDDAFDVLWCRLVIGHLPACGPAYAELSRVAAKGARVIVSDFHPVAHAAGHRRTFRREGEVVEVEHHVHQISTQIRAARSAGLRLEQVQVAKIGPDARPFYERAGRAALYREHRGLPVVVALVFEKER